MANIFLSYTSSDRDWAFWIAEELKVVGHTPHVHEWEVNAGANIYAWMGLALAAVGSDSALPRGAEERQAI